MHVSGYLSSNCPRNEKTVGFWLDFGRGRTIDILLVKLKSNFSLFRPLVTAMGRIFSGGIMWSHENSIILAAAAPAPINNLSRNSAFGFMVPPATTTWRNQYIWYRWYESVCLVSLTDRASLTMSPKLPAGFNSRNCNLQFCLSGLFVIKIRPSS